MTTAGSEREKSIVSTSRRPRTRRVVFGTKHVVCIFFLENALLSFYYSITT